MNDIKPYTFATNPRVEFHDGRHQTVYPCGCKTAGNGHEASPARIIFCSVHSKAYNLRDALRDLCLSCPLLTNKAKNANTRAANLLALVTTR